MIKIKTNPMLFSNNIITVLLIACHYLNQKTEEIRGLVWFLCLMAYQLFLGYLMAKPFS